MIFKGKFKDQGCLRVGNEEGDYYLLENGSLGVRYQKSNTFGGLLYNSLVVTHGLGF